MVCADARRHPEPMSEHTNTHPRDPPPAAQPLRSHACRRQRGPGSLLRDPPRHLPRRLRRPHPPRRRRHPHLRRRGARHARRGQGGLDRHGGAPQPARPAVAADRARAPRRRGRHPALAGDAVVRRRRVVALPARGRADPLAHAPAAGAAVRQPRTRRQLAARGLAARAAPLPQARASRFASLVALVVARRRDLHRRRSTSTSATASATATYVVTSVEHLHDEYRARDRLARPRPQRACSSPSGETHVDVARRRRRPARDRPRRCRAADPRRRPRSARSTCRTASAATAATSRASSIETGERVLVLDAHVGAGAVRVERAVR